MHGGAAEVVQQHGVILSGHWGQSSLYFDVVGGRKVNPWLVVFYYQFRYAVDICSCLLF